MITLLQRAQSAPYFATKKVPVGRSSHVHQLPTHECNARRYVQQEVVLPGTSTVWEYLTFHASLRLPAQTPSEEVQERVAAVAEQLGLTKVR
eukprot:1152790-Pelagomonas_calceolata.AAC.1